MLQLCYMPKNNGFTLIELMIVVLVIGLLAAVSVPSFQKYVVKARVSEGYILLDAIRKGELSYHLENSYFGAGPISAAANTDQNLQTVLDGGKFQATNNSMLMNEISYIIPADQFIGFYINVIRGGYIETDATYEENAGNKINYAATTSGTACSSDAHIGTTIDSFGIVDNATDQSHDYYFVSAIANLSNPGSENCIFLNQFVQTWGNGFQTSPFIQLD